MRKLNRNAYTEDGGPKYVRVYDNGGESVDRYTVVFSQLRFGVCVYLGMSENPFWGIGQHGEHHTAIDRPSYGHLGKKITFDDLPKACQQAVMIDYEAYWGVWTPKREVA